MSFLDVAHHQAHAHSDYLTYTLHYCNGPGPPAAAVICLACFLDSIADPDTLATRKSYVIRQLTDMLSSIPAFGAMGGSDYSSGGSVTAGVRDQVVLLRDIATQHASLVVSALVDLAIWNNDAALEESLHRLCVTLCNVTAATCTGYDVGPNFLAEMFVHRCATVLEDILAAEMPQPQPQSQPQPYSHPSLRTQTHPGHCAPPVVLAPASGGPSPGPLLQLLVDLTQLPHQQAQTHRDDGGPIAVLLKGLATSPVLLKRLLEALIVGNEIDCWRGRHAGGVKSLVLRLLLTAAQHPSVEAAELVAAVGQPLFERCVALLGRMAAGRPAGAQHADPRPLCLELLTALVEQGCVLEQTHGSVGVDLAASSQLAAQLVAGLKPCLLDSSRPALQCAACRLLGVIAGRSHPRLVQQIIHADLAEYLFEVLRTAAAAEATAAIDHRALAAAGVLQLPVSQHQAAAAEAAGELIRLAVVALSYLAQEGPHFRCRLHFGVEVLSELCAAAAASCDHGLAADLTSLLGMAVIRPYHSVEAGGGGSGGAAAAGLGIPGGPVRLPLVDVRRILTAIEPLFPRPSGADVDILLPCGGNNSGIPAAAAVLTATGAEGPVRLSEAHAACCRSACEVLSGVCGWEGTPQHSEALQPPLLKAIGSALQGLTVTAADSLGFAPGGYLWAACQLAVDAATVMPSLAPASTDTAATAVDMSEHGTGPPLVLCARRLTAELLSMWEAWVMSTVDRWYSEAQELGIEMQQVLPVMSRTLHAAVVPLSIALSGPRISAGPAAESSHPTLPPAEDPAICAATTLASHLLASGWVQFSFEVLAAAAAVAQQDAEATAVAAAAAGRAAALPGGARYEGSCGGDVVGLAGQPGTSDTSGSGVSGEIRLQVWRLLMLISSACGLDVNGDDIGGVEPTDAEELSTYDSMAALMSGFESVAHVLEFLATGGAQQVVANVGGSGHVLVAGSAMNCFLRLLRCTLAAGDMGWAVTGGTGLEWLLVALSHVLAEPVVQAYWPRVWWQCLDLYREVEGRMAAEQGPIALPQHLLASLEHMMQQQQPHPAAPASLKAKASSKPHVAASRACGVAAPLSCVGLPMSIWVMKHADQLPSIIAAALPVWLGLDVASTPAEMGRQHYSDTTRSGQQQIRATEDLSAAWPLEDVLEAAAKVAGSNVATSIATRLLQRCAETGVGTANWVHRDGRDAGSAGDSLLGVYDLQSGARLLIRLLQLLSTCLNIRPQLAVIALDAGLLVSTRRLLLDLASAAGQRGDPWATAGVTWVLLLQMQLLLAVAVIAADDVTVSSESDTASGDSTWCMKALSEICQQVGRAAVKVLLLAEHQPQQTAFQPSGCDADADAGADADADAMHDIRAPSVSHSPAVVKYPGATKLRSVCFKAVAMGIVLDVSLGGHVPAAAVMAESETLQCAARLDVAKAVTNASGATETCASALLFLAVSALYQCNSSNSNSGFSGILSGLSSEEPSVTAHMTGQIITAARPPSPPSVLEELLLLATTATAQVVQILALNCIWLRLVLHPDEVEGMLPASGGKPGGVPTAVGQEALPGRLGPTQRLELLSCVLSNAACDNLGSIRSPALLGLSILASYTCEDGAGGMPLLQVLPWARTLLHQVVGRVCTAHSISSSARGFGSECADSGQGLPLHMELLAALQGFPDLAFVCSLQGAVARAAEVSGPAPEPQKPGHGAPDIDGSGGALGWILDDLRAAASDNLLVQALLQPQHPASQPLSNSCTAGLVCQGLLGPAMLGRARNAAAGRVWRLQQPPQQQQQEVDGTGAGNAIDGVVMLQHLLRLCSSVEPAAAAVEMSGLTCGPPLLLCCSDTFQSWVVPALLFVLMSQEWNRRYARGSCFARSRDTGTRLQHVLGKWLLKGPLSGTNDEVLLRCIDSQMKGI